MCGDETFDMEKQEDLSQSQRKLIKAILDCISTGGSTENSQSGLSASLIATHLLVSAIEGEGVLQPGEHCFPTVLFHTV